MTQELMQMEVQKQRVVLLPFMAQGHINPFLYLADLIHRRNPSFAVVVVNTPANIRALRSSLPPTTRIELQSLPFYPSDHGLPPGAETAADLPVHLFINLFHASETLRPAFEQLLSDLARADGRPPLCIIADVFFGWTVDIARKLGTFHAAFNTSGAYGTALFNSLLVHLPHTRTTSDELELPEFPEVSINRSQLTKYMKAADGTDPWSIFFRRNISYCQQTDSILVNTADGFERTGLAMFRKAAGRIPIWPIGPLLRLPASTSHSNRSFLEWLDRNPPASVLYVSFGSQNTITAPQMMELAMGLEASGRPFIWAVRPPVGFDIKGEFRAEWLPEGFEERGQGMVVRGWAPQVEILSHPSTGAFMSHCGWNSVLESLSRGVPIIGWPLSGEQMFNSKMLEEEAGVCVEVARGYAEGSGIERGKVERVIGAVMGGTDKGREMKRRAGEAAEVLRAAMKEEGEEGGGAAVGSSVRGLDEFLQAAIARRGDI